tara:strand:+ start:88 stop:420 length:333 start_codon:yes stop_codon:yes gene_type:complete
MDKNVKKIIFDYFKFWQNKNLTGLESVLDSNIKLTDWDNSINGLENVLKFNKDFFENVGDINLLIESYSISNKVAFVHLKIEVAGEEIEVIDKIIIGDLGKISNIHAFKC